MTTLTPEDLWQMPKKKFISLIESGEFRNKTKEIYFYAPSFVNYTNRFFRSSRNSFPSLSVTGSSCELNCKHCNKKVLNTMTPTLTPQEFFEVCQKLKNKGAQGCLISGGCNTDGSVPLTNFFDVIAKVKNDLGLTLAIHTGFIDFSAARQLKDSGVDSILIDIIGSDETINEIYNLDVTVNDYKKSLKALYDVKIPFVPHVLVGLHFGELKGEFEALKMIAQYSPSAVIVIALMPIRGTVLEKVKPPKPEDVLRTLVCAKLLMPNVPVVLGCMRPKSEYRKQTDTLAVKAGVDAIAFPVEEAIELAQSMGLETKFWSVCCSQIYELDL